MTLKNSSSKSQRQIMGQLKLRFPRLAHAVRSIFPSMRKRQQRRWELENKTPQEIFTSIYEENYWNSDESVSGGGSTLEATASLRRDLPELLAELGIKSILDAPCGDFYWMRKVELGVEQYIGGDIVPALIENLTAEYAGDSGRTFRVIDLTTDSLPDVDALFCRDCLQHLSLELAQQVLDNFSRSSCRYLITTTFPDVKFNPKGLTGGTNTLNLQIAPFELPSPLRSIEDHGSHDAVYRRCLSVWSRDQLV